MNDNNPKDFSLRTPLANARGLGAARQGTHHWWVQRVTSLVLIPASLWLVVSVILMINQPYEVVRNWFGNIFVCTLLTLTLLALFYHSILGVQVILEDYVHRKGALIGMLLFLKTILYLLGAVSILAVLKMGLNL